jgi:hypothetical protein
VLVGVVILGAGVISTGAAYESFRAFRGLAIFFGWPESHAWVPMPLVEVFLLIGSAELALRTIEGGKTWGPRVIAYGALVVTLAVNVLYAVLTLILPMDDAGQLMLGALMQGVRWWQPVAIGAFAAIVPTAQLIALHLLTGRLQRLAAARRNRPAVQLVDDEPVPSISRLLRRAAVQRITAGLAQPEQPPTAAPPAPVLVEFRPVDETAPPADDMPAPDAPPEASRGEAPRPSPVAPVPTVTLPPPLSTLRDRPAHVAPVAPPRGEAPRPAVGSAPPGAPRGEAPRGEAPRVDDDQGDDETPDNAVPIGRGADKIGEALRRMAGAFAADATSWADFRAQLDDEANLKITIRKIIDRTKNGSAMGRRRILGALEYTDLYPWPTTPDSTEEAAG